MDANVDWSGISKFVVSPRAILRTSNASGLGSKPVDLDGSALEFAPASADGPAGSVGAVTVLGTGRGTSSFSAIAVNKNATSASDTLTLASLSRDSNAKGIVLSIYPLSAR